MRLRPFLLLALGSAPGVFAAPPMHMLGRVAAGERVERLVVRLRRPVEAEADLSRFLKDQQNPSSPDYHRWLTPDEFGRRFGASDADVIRAATVLARSGLEIRDVARGRGWLTVSGKASDVERAFGIELEAVESEGDRRVRSSRKPVIPPEIDDVVAGTISLTGIRKHPQIASVRTAADVLQPQFTDSSGNHDLTPGDFATIYDTLPLISRGIDGSNQSIAVVGRTDINIGDVRYFRSLFGLPANDPVFVHNGPAPGNLGGIEETEADLDVEWSGAVAPWANIQFVISASTSANDGADLSAMYIVENNLAPVLTESFGACEQSLGADFEAFYKDLWSQAAAEGITVVISSGDSGAAGCDFPTQTTASQGLAVNGLCSTPFDLCVGGTEFLDQDSTSNYWAVGNDPVTRASALSYIPETAWNESAGELNGSGLYATGGGASGVFAKPDWQVGPGVPADGQRDVPDISFAAADHTAYFVNQDNTSSSADLHLVSGTSASAPAFAGIMALVNQAAGGRQGAPNRMLYSLGADQYGGSGAAVFHDVVAGSNSVPGLEGYDCGIGFDLSTGLGSVDAAILALRIAELAGTCPFDPGACALPVSGDGTAVVTGRS